MIQSRTPATAAANIVDSRSMKSVIDDLTAVIDLRVQLV
jgi:hypothetical protein